MYRIAFGKKACKQPVLFILSIDQKNQYPKYIKLKEIVVDNKSNIKNFFDQYVYMNRETILTTDGKNTVNFLKDQINVKIKKSTIKIPEEIWVIRN